MRPFSISYKAYADGFSDFEQDYPEYYEEMGINDLDSRIYVGSITLYLSVGLAF